MGVCPEPAGMVIVEEGARKLGIRVALLTACSRGRSAPSASSGALDSEVARLLEELREMYTLDSLREDPVVRAYRSFYWRIGVDPTKTRPSSEALVRRALRGRWPRISPVVDAGNIASARSMVPIGLYDLDSFEPPARLALSSGGELFEPIGGGEERLPRGLPILVDSRGVVMHLYPHRDSRRTMIRKTTTRLLALAAGVPGVGGDLLLSSLRELARLLGVLGWESRGPVLVE